MARVSAVLDSASVTTNANTSATITVKAHLKNGSSSSGWGAGLKVYIDGDLVENVTGYSNTSGGKFASVTATKKITKTTSNQSITCKITAYSTTVDGMGGCGDSNIDPKTVSKKVTVSALDSYTVSYDANGGSGAPSSQKKYYGKTLTLSSTKPTKTGYTFKGWATSASGSVAYSAGGSYTANSAVTLYAVWSSNTVYIFFNANGGNGAPAQITTSYNKATSLPTTIPVRSNYSFKGWATSSTATSASYSAGGSITPTGNVTLYAVWEFAAIPPTITSVNNIGRTSSTSSTELVDDGSYLYCVVNYNYSDTSVIGSSKKLYYTIKQSNGTSVASGSISQTASTASGSITFRYFTAVSSDTTYIVEFYIYDDTYATTSNTITVRFPKKLVTLQVYKGGTGVGVGCYAPSSGFKVGFSSTFTEPVTCENGLTVNGYDYSPSSSGNRFGVVPLVLDDGVMEIGKYIDWHTSDGDTGEYAVRMTCDGSNIEFSGGIKAASAAYSTTLSIIPPFAVYESGYEPLLKASAGVVNIRGTLKPGEDGTGSSTRIKMAGPIPSAYQPNKQINLLCQGSTTCQWLLTIETDGYLYFSRYSKGGSYAKYAATNWLPFNITYIL